MTADSANPEQTTGDARLDILFSMFSIPSHREVRRGIHEMTRRNASVLRHPSSDGKVGNAFKGAARLMELEVISRNDARIAGLLEAHVLGNPEVDADFRALHLRHLMSGVGGEESINPLARKIRPVGYDHLIEEMGRAFDAASLTSVEPLRGVLEQAQEVLPYIGVQGVDLDSFDS